MFCSRRFQTCVLMFTLAALAGCETELERPKRHGSQGGFSVLVDNPDRPASSRVMADVGAFAQAHGFSRLPARPGPPLDPVTREPIPRAPERYGRGDLTLDVSYQPTTHRVSAYLRSPESTRDIKAIRKLYADFHREYASRYGAPDPVSEIAFSDDSSGPEAEGQGAGTGIGGTRSAGLPAGY